jgi:phosphatidylserine/phosphatidylglycerophosphate/cardiolipin synthase-like enzyme
MTTPREDLDGMSLDDLTRVRFEDLGRFKAGGKFPYGYSSDVLTFYAPRDPYLHIVIIWTLLQATHTVAINMFGFDDDQAAAIIRLHTRTPTIAVTLSLDSTQAAGKHEATLLETFNHDLVGNSIAIGRSSRSAISHNKLLVVDGQYLISGSTNWSYTGEVLQDNQLSLSRDPLAAAEARAIIDMNHDDMLKQMSKKTQRSASAKLGAAHRKLEALQGR